MSVFDVFNKKIIFILCILAWLIWTIWISQAQVSLNPIYTTDRFQPSDMFHAWCENYIDVVFDLTDVEIAWVNAILKYNNADIDIIKIIPQWEKENNLTYVIEKDTIIFNKLKTETLWLDKIIFSVFFEGDTNLKSTEFGFVTWSYVVDINGAMFDINSSYKFDFATVPECNPDIIAPSVEMIFPAVGTGEYTALDSYFQFEISDQGKWINKDSVNISIDDIKYDLSNVEHEWDENMLTIYPDTWLSIWSKISLSIDVQDKQVYWKANISTEKYDLQTSTWLYLLNDIDPVQFRKLVNKEKYYQWSVEECNLLSDVYVDWDEETQKNILSINKRLSCGEIVSLSNPDSLVWGDGNLVVEFKSKFSVFAILGWILFWLLLFIKIFGYLAKWHKE